MEPLEIDVLAAGEFGAQGDVITETGDQGFVCAADKFDGGFGSLGARVTEKGE